MGQVFHLDHLDPLSKTGQSTLGSNLEHGRNLPPQRSDGRITKNLHTQIRVPQTSLPTCPETDDAYVESYNLSRELEGEHCRNQGGTKASFSESEESAYSSSRCALSQEGHRSRLASLSGETSFSVLANCSWAGGEACRISSGGAVPGGGSSWSDAGAEEILARSTTSRLVRSSLWPLPFLTLSRCGFLVLDAATAATGADLVEASVETGVGRAIFDTGREGLLGTVDLEAEGFNRPVVSVEGIGASAFSKRAC